MNSICHLISIKPLLCNCEHFLQNLNSWGEHHSIHILTHNEVLNSRSQKPTRNSFVHYRTMIICNSKVCRKLSKKTNVGDYYQANFQFRVSSVYLIPINVLHLSISAFTNTSFTQQTTIKFPFICTVYRNLTLMPNGIRLLEGQNILEIFSNFSSSV